MSVQKKGQGASAARPGSLKRAAEQLGLSLPSVYALIRAGKLRTYHVGRAHRVSDEAIRECVALLECESAESRALSRGGSQ